MSIAALPDTGGLLGFGRPNTIETLALLRFVPAARGGCLSGLETARKGSFDAATTGP